MSIITELESIINERKATPTATSYTASLFAKGEDKIVQKFGEEAVEVLIAAKGQGKQRVIEETADLLYHLLVMLAHHDIAWQDVEAELAKRRS